MKFYSFTLAEVLITLGIIGVVSAMTMPVLIQNHQKSIVEAHLNKFYSMINQAIINSEIDNGMKEDWWRDLTGAELDQDGNTIEGSSKSEVWFKKYIGQYIHITKIETHKNGGLIVYFPDGSALMQNNRNTTRDWIYLPVNPDRCIKKMDSQGVEAILGTCGFAYNFYPNNKSNADWKYHYQQGFEPWKYKWDGTKESLYKNCSGESSIGYKYRFCTALIQMNNWKIPNNYPRKISY